MTHILIPREPSAALLRPFIGCNTQELHEAWAAMVRIAEVQHARAGSQCLAQIEEPAGAAPAAVAPQGEYPHLPQSVGDVTDFGDGKVDIDWGHPAPVGGTRLYSADQMRAYVDADRVARAGQPAAVTGPALALVERQALEALCAVAVAAFHAADDSSDNGNIIEVQRADFEALDAALDLLDELPDDQPGYTMTPGAKAKWTLRRLLDAAPALEAPAAPDCEQLDVVARKKLGVLLNAFGEAQWQAGRGVPCPSIEDAFEAVISAAVDLLAAAPQAPAAPSAEGLREQHDRDSAELRRLCQARDEARRERDIARAEIAGLQASTGHLSALVDGQHALLEKAKATMTALHGSASPIDESGGDFDARIPASAFARFVDEHAALLHAMAQSPVAAPAAPAVDAWLPIATAPAEKLVLVAAEFDGPGDWRIKMGDLRRDGTWHVLGASWVPTRWMPLPPVPGEAANAFTYDELLEIQRAACEFFEGEDTDVDYGLLMRAAQAGYLECSQFQVRDTSALESEIAAAQAKEGGAQ